MFAQAAPRICFERRADGGRNRRELFGSQIGGDHNHADVPQEWLAAAAAQPPPSPTSSSAPRKVKTPPSRLLRESRSVRLRAFAAAKHVLRWRARIARAALARLRLGLLSLLMLERPRDGAIDVEPERVHVHLVGEHGGTTDCSSCRAAQGRALTSDAGGRRRDGQGYALDAA